MSTRRYAENTEIPAEQSLSEIKALLKKHGANKIVQGEDERAVAVMFELAERRYRFVVPIPAENDPEITTVRVPNQHWNHELARNPRVRREKREQIERARLRALLLVIKAKLEAVAVGMTTLEDEFLSALVLPSGETVAEWAKPQVARAYALAAMPPMLSLGPGMAALQSGDTKP